MSVKSFKFVSPGVFVNEVDNSQLPRLPEEMGPVIIGRAERGPAMVPVKIDSFSEFVETFGEPIAGAQADDAWRQGNRLGPTYGAYAAQAYLKNGSPITFVRLLGEAHPDAVAGASVAQAGWKMTKVFGLFVDDDGNAGSADGGELAAVIYTNVDDAAAVSASMTSDDIKISIKKSAQDVVGTSGSHSLKVDDAGKFAANAQTFFIAKTSSSSIQIEFSSATASSSFASNKLTIGTADIDLTADVAETLIVSRLAQEINRLGNAVAVTASASGADLTLVMDDVGAVDISAEGGTSFIAGELFDMTGADSDGHTKSPTPTAGTASQQGTTSTESYIVNFDRNSKKYIRNVLNTNPTLTNSGITKKTESYFLGATYDQHIEGTVTAKINAVDVRDLSGTASSNLKDATPAESPWVLSQYLGSAADLANPLVPDDLTQLFKFHTLYSGAWEQANFKISIVDVSPPSNDFVKYGTFTVLLRSAEDNDASPVVYERFSNVNLDPTSSRYIAAVIGDMKMVWSPEEKRYKHEGEHPNQSRYIRVQMNSDVDQGAANPELLPFGFALPHQFSGGPKFALRENTKDDTKISDPTDACFGVTTDRPEALGRFDESYVDMVRPLHANTDMFAGTDLFSLDLIKRQGKNDAELSTGSFKAGSSFNGSGKSYEKVLEAGFDKFTMPLCGGSDGLDITQIEPFCDDFMQQSGADSAVTNYAYYSITKAIDAVSDPEVVECNLMAIPGVAVPGLTGKLISTCEARGDALAVIDLQGDYVPRGWNDDPEKDRLPQVSQAVSNLKGRGISSSYGCAFFPWVQVSDELSNRKVWMPPSVVALGTMASSTKKSELWFAPAGFTRGGLSAGAGGLPVSQVRLRLNSKERDALYEANINPIAQFPAEGIVVFGQKTLQVTPSALDRINVRRLMIHVKKEISRMAATTLFDQNVKATWNRFKNKAEPFLDSVQTRFGLTEYKIVLDETTTTPELIDRNIMYAKVFLKPARAIEFIAIDFVITNTGASFED